MKSSRFVYEWTWRSDPFPPALCVRLALKSVNGIYTPSEWHAGLWGRLSFIHPFSACGDNIYNKKRLI